MAELDNITKTAAALNREVERGGRAAAATGEEVSKLGDSLFKVGNLLRAGTVKVVGEAVLNYAKQFTAFTAQQILQRKQEHMSSLKEIGVLKEKLATMRLAGDASLEEINLTKQTLDLAVGVAKTEAKRLAVAEVFHETIGETLRTNKLLIFTGYLFRDALKDTVGHAMAYNQSLMQANTAFKERYALTQNILQVQTQTGAASESLAESAQALVAYGLEQRDSFKENLGLVSMLRDGLGVAASTGAELVVTFERGLNQSARGVADTIANIAAQTGLAAQKAAQYAIELARSLRLLGPMRVDAGGVAKAVEGIAARVEELGGNSQAVVALYKQMLGGTAQSFLLRGIAGAPNPGSLGSAAGAQQALEGLARSMQRIVTAGPGTAMYTAQLELAAQFHGVAADDVRNYLEAIELTHKPLTEGQTLLKAYREQTQLTGEAWKQVGNALASLYQRFLTPILRWIAPVIRGLADLVNWIANTKVALVTAGVGITVSFLAATAAMYKLIRAATIFASTSIVGEMIPGLKTAGALFRNFGLIARMTKAPLLTGFGGAQALLGGGLAGGLGALAFGASAVGAAGAAGYGAGRLLDKWMPEKDEWYSVLNPLQWLKIIARDTGNMVEATKPSTYASVRTPAFDALQKAANEIAKMISTPGDYSTTRMATVLKNYANRSNQTAATLGVFTQGVMEQVRKNVVAQQWVDAYKNRTTVRLPEDVVRDKELATTLKMAESLASSEGIQQDMAASSMKHLELVKKLEASQSEKEHTALFYMWEMGQEKASNVESFQNWVHPGIH